jgi:hypothetical protein
MKPEPEPSPKKSGPTHLWLSPYLTIFSFSLPSTSGIRTRYFFHRKNAVGYKPGVSVMMLKMSFRHKIGS